MGLYKQIIFSLLVFIVCADYVNAQRYQKCPNGTVWTPHPGTSWYWYLGETVTTATVDAHPAQVYDFDLFATPTSVIDYIHSLNRTIICYIDTAYEPNRPDSSQFSKKVLGKSMKGWPGQKWVDIRSDAVKDILYKRLELAWAKGCDAVEWDDVDAYANSPGFRISPSDQANFNVYLARITHEFNMSVGLKNDLDQIDILVDYFDWALNEQCVQFGECDQLQPFIDQNKAVFGAEYQGNAGDNCGQLNSRGFSWLYTNVDLTIAGGTACCKFKSPPCPNVEYSCMPTPLVYPVFSNASKTSFLASALIFLMAIILLNA